MDTSKLYQNKTREVFKPWIQKYVEEGEAKISAKSTDDYRGMKRGIYKDTKYNKEIER